METNNVISVCGTITKKESLIPIQSHILENSWVAEANFPYSNYYGHRPVKPKPNSLFLFTERYYSLEEVLRFSDLLNEYFKQKINVASATLEFHRKQFPAIRVKNFPDYEQLHVLQKILMNQGVVFSKKTPLVTEIKAVINKCFELELLEEDIYIDSAEEHKGYIVLHNKIDRNNFENLMFKIRNNSNCSFYDAVPGGFIIKNQSIDFVRIYSEKMNLELLKCLKEFLLKYNK